jgi:hypothetical protein
VRRTFAIIPFWLCWPTCRWRGWPIPPRIQRRVTAFRGSLTMALIRYAPALLYLFGAVSMGCRHAPQEPERHLATESFAVPRAPLPQRESPSLGPEQSAHAAPGLVAEQPLEDVEERKGPFTFGGQTFTVVTHTKRMRGARGDSAQALASLDIVDAAGTVLHHEEFAYPIENGDFAESCSVGVDSITGSNGAGLLLDTGCLPSAPLSGGPWQIFGVVNGKLALIGKPLYAEGEMGDFVPGKINHIGNVTQILADELRIRVFTGYFFVSVPVRVNWLEGTLALAQRCFYQTGHGLAEDGCEMPVEGVEQHREQDLTFVRMFAESNEQIGTPAHVVIQKNSRVEILAAKVLVKWEEGKDAIELGVGDDIWVKIRIDGKEGWVHTEEDLQAIGLYRSG